MYLSIVRKFIKGGSGFILAMTAIENQETRSMIGPVSGVRGDDISWGKNVI